MNYQCTRNSAEQVSAAQAIAQGISADGGLFVPECLPQYDLSVLEELKNASYTQRAERILGDFLSDFTPEEIHDCVEKAYGDEKFSGGHPAPLAELVNCPAPVQLLELWHGPTCAFKDMALQLLPHLLTKSLKKIHSDKTAVILVATSGDTGKAALEGFRDVEGTKIMVFYPQNGVSAMQKTQMTTQEGNNVSVCAIEGNFDDAQTGVKRIFTDPAMKEKLAEHGMMFSSANSINWGRLLPQIVYYFSAYCDLMAQGKVQAGQKINVVVPTGNFGNILAAYYAKKMGLPVNKLICASNANNVLTEFLRTGVYDRNRQFFTTISPSMDILVSSNLERLLYDLTGCDSERVAGWMKQLSETGRYEVGPEMLQKLQELFYAGFCDDSQTAEAISEVYEMSHYVCDTHTAVAVQVYRHYLAETEDKQTPTVVASTANPYKFATSVLMAVDQNRVSGNDLENVRTLAALTGAPVPGPISALEGKPVRFTQCCTPDNMSAMVLSGLGISE